MDLLIFHGLSAVAVLLFTLGVWRRVALWRSTSEQGFVALVRSSAESTRKGLRGGGARSVVVDGVLGYRLWRASRYRWFVHAALAWSFLGLFFVGSLGDMVADFGVPLSKNEPAFALANDTFGVFLLLGVALAAARRLRPDAARPAQLFDDWFVLGALAVLALGGFLVEASRFLEQATPPSTGGYAFAGFALARALKGLPISGLTLHAWLWWSHGLLALAFVAWIPHSKLFHIFTAPATLMRRAATSPAAAPAVPARQAVPLPLVGLPGGVPHLAGGQALELDACIRCGECLRACSSFQARDDDAVAIAGMIRQRRALSAADAWNDGTAALERYETGVFSCTLCGRCEEVCPVGIRTRSLSLAIRHELATAHCRLPKNLGIARDAVIAEGNVFNFPNEDRAMWADFLDDVPADLTAKDHADVLYYVGCVSSFSPAIQEIPQAFLQVLLQAGMDVAVLGERERCCGFPLIMGGLASDARDLIAHNMAEVRRLGVRQIVFNCPSCYYTWKKYYPVGDIKLSHAAEIVRDLVRDGWLVVDDAEAVAATYHDPCDLGRGLGVYDAPREVLRGFAGDGYVELTQSRELSLCCGGGGDVEMWDPDLVASVNSRLTDAIVASGANLVIQGCPQCKRVTQRGLESRGSKVRSLDIAEFAVEYGRFVPHPVQQEPVGAKR